MSSIKSKLNESFWADDPDLTQRTFQSKGCLTNLLKLYAYFLAFLMIGGGAIILAYLTDHICASIWLAFSLSAMGYSYYQQRQRLSTKQQVKVTQMRAQEKIGTPFIGSATHVAGHPLLIRDQRIVLALKEGQLFFFNFTSQDAIGSIPVKEIKKLNTVVYDNERVPYIDVIDSAAQALQIQFTWQEEILTCLFNRMQNMRPIDWYHAIQKERAETF